MVEILRFPPSRAEAQAAAAHWIARVERGLTDDEAAQLRRWLAEDARHYDAFMTLAALWDETDVLGELADLFPFARPRPAKRRLVRFAALAAAACAVVFIAVGGYAVHRAMQGAPAEAVDPGGLTAGYATEVGAQSVESLNDGTVIRLNTDSQVSVAYSKTERNVRLLRGEASFDVVRDAARPFNVHAGGRIVQVVGTAFNVRLESDGGLEVAVTSGTVRVAQAASGGPRPAGRESGAVEPTLSEGEVAILGNAGSAAGTAPRIVRLEPVDMEIKLSWQRGVLVFRGQRLDAMLEEFERYTTSEFALADDELAELRVGGSFRPGDVEALLVALRENFGIESERHDTGRIALRAER